MFRFSLYIYIYIIKGDNTLLGRRIGVAISLAATEKERVWFCQKGTKGRGPNGRAPPCEDTSDYDKGGNCVW